MGILHSHGFIKKAVKIVDPLILQFFHKVKYNCGKMGIFLQNFYKDISLQGKNKTNIRDFSRLGPTSQLQLGKKIIKTSSKIKCGLIRSI